MSNTGSKGEDGVVVSVTSQGQATIPKVYREALGVSTPGRVRFREDEDGRIVVERVRDLREFRGIAPEGTSLTDELADSRDDELGDELGDECNDGSGNGRDKGRGDGGA